MLPTPMLARSGQLPAGAGYAYELKFDGFRAVVRTGREFRVPSRRGWNMTHLLPELENLPVDAVLDGELVALGQDGWPHFPLVCDRLLHGVAGIRLTLCVFDVLEVDGASTMTLPYQRRRQLLEDIELGGPHWQTAPAFAEPEPLLSVVHEHGLEGIVAKRLNSLYRPGERGWLKVKNRNYWRYGLELEAVRKRFSQRPVIATIR